MTTSYLNARERYRLARPVKTPTHKFSVGDRVAHRISPSGERGNYRVTRRLPDGGQGLQYRIQSERDGQERVVVEAALESWG